MPIAPIYGNYSRHSGIRKKGNRVKVEVHNIRIAVICKDFAGVEVNFSNVVRKDVRVVSLVKVH